MLAAPWTSRPALLERPWRPFAPLERPLFGPRRRQRVVLGAAAAAVSGVSGRTSGTPKALEPAVQVLMTNLKVSEAQALRMSKDIRKFAVARDGDDAMGSRSVAWAKKLCRGLEMHAGLEPLLRHVGGVEKVLLELEKRSRKHTQVFQDIAQQHEALREGDDIDMEEYSKTAEYMGHEWWVRASHQRIIDRIDQYYLLSADQLHRGHPPWVFCKNNRLPKGWREYTLQGRRMFWNPETMRMQNQVPESLTLAQAPEPVEPPVKLLDIGSSINRFKDWPFYVEAHALDLQPVAEDVHQADFFDLEIVEAPDAESPLCVKDGKLEGLVAKSFDVVVLSLVLSFLPSPEKRIEMVAKARQCLRDHRGLLFVVEGGSAIMEGNWYQKDAAAEWSQAMETAGFKVMNFDSQLREGRRSKPVLQWTLETKEVDDTELAPLVLGKELEW